MLHDDETMYWCQGSNEFDCNATQSHEKVKEVVVYGTAKCWTTCYDSVAIDKVRVRGLMKHMSDLRPHPCTVDFTSSEIYRTFF